MTKEDKVLVEHLESAVKQLAMERAMILHLGIMDEEDIGKFLNEKGEEYTLKYMSMNPVDIMLEGLVELAEIKARNEMEDK